MKRYSLDGARCIAICVRGIAGMAFLCCMTHPRAVRAALTQPDLLRIADEEGDSPLLLPNEVENGLRQRFLDLQTRQQLREEKMDAVEPRDYQLDAPPASVDVPRPADALGGEMFEERIEVMP